MNICYLDYDAVLHDGNVLRNRARGMYIATPDRRFFEWMPILVDLLAPYPDLKIVLSTTWVRELGFDAARQRQGEPRLRTDRARAGVRLLLPAFGC